jgi:hypothetical protein
MTKTVYLKDNLCEVHKFVGKGVRDHCTSIIVFGLLILWLHAGAMGLTFTVQSETSVCLQTVPSVKQ